MAIEATKIGILQRGASLLELLVTMSIVGILFSAAIPSYIDFSVRNRIVSYSNEFISAINLARSESIRRGTPVSICPSDNNADCGGTWSDGWIVFSNVAGEDPPAVDAGDVLIKAFPPLSQNFTIVGDAAVNGGLTYGPDGSARTIGALAVCHNDEAEGARAIIVTRLRPRVARDTDDNKIPNIDDGSDIVSCTSPSI